MSQPRKIHREHFSNPETGRRADSPESSKSSAGGQINHLEDTMKRQFSQKKKTLILTRRGFLQQSACGALGLTLAGKFAAGAAVPSVRSGPGQKSRVVLARHSKVIDAAGRVQQPLLTEMLDKALTAFTGRGTIADAWREYISPEDVVGLKINTLGLNDLRGSEALLHFPAMIAALSAGLNQAGVPDKNIVVWDRSDQELESAGLRIQKEPGRMRILGNNLTRREPGVGFHPDSHAVGDKTTRLSRILTDICTAVVNVPVIKTHGSAGFTCALKNQYGSIDNAREFHSNNCTNPGIPEVNKIPIIRNKQKLIVCDALLTAIDSGPRWRRSFLRPFGAILIATDPVALDTVTLGILDELRAADGLPALSGRIVHLPLAEKLELGTNQSGNIDLVKLDLG